MNFDRRVVRAFVASFLSLASLSSHVALVDHAVERAKHACDTIVCKTLPNGLQVVVYPKRNIPDVYLQLVYKVGSAHETTEATYGFAHLLEHMSFKGTTEQGLGLTEADIFKIGDKMHLTGINANTSYDRTLYFFHADTRNWKIFLGILADWMGNLKLNEQHLNSEMNAVYQEIKMRDQDSSGDVFAEFMPYGHPYSHPIIGFKENILRAHTDEIRGFYEKCYAPNNAALIVVGNIDPETLFSQAEKLFGHYEASATSLASDVDESGCARIPKKGDFSTKDCTIYAEVPRTSIDLIWTIPGAQDGAVAVARCISAVLSERLYRSLYDKHKAVLTIGASSSPLVLDNVFGVSFTPQDSAFVVDDEKNKTTVLHGDDVTAFCIETIAAEIESIIKNGLTDDELARYKQVMASRFLKSFESVSAIGSQLFDAYLTNRLATDPFNTAQWFTLSNESVEQFAYTYLRPFLMNKMITTPVPEEEKENWMRLRRSVDHHDASLLAQRVRTEPNEEPSYLHKLTEPQPLAFSFEQPDQIMELSNGIKVYLKQQGDIPYIFVCTGFVDAQDIQLRYAIDKKASVPAFAMSQLIEESVGVSKTEHEDFFDHAGARYYFRSTISGFSCYKSEFVDVAKRFTHIMSKPLFPDDVFQARRSETIVALEMSKQDPYKVATKKLESHLYQPFPWVMPDEEIIQGLRGLQRSDLVDFHRRYFVPSNMYVVIVGDYDRTTIAHELEATLGQWHVDRRSSVAAEEIPEIINPPAAQLSSFLPHDQVVIACARLTVPSNEDDHMCLRLLNNYLGQQLFSIREKTGLFYSCWSDLTYQSSDRIPGYARIVTQVAPGNVDHAMSAIRMVLSHVARQGISQAELDTAKNLILNVAARSVVKMEQKLSKYVDIIGNKREFDYYMKRLERYKAITLEQVNEVARKYLAPEEWTQCIVGRVVGEES